MSVTRPHSWNLSLYLVVFLFVYNAQCIIGEETRYHTVRIFQIIQSARQRLPYENSQLQAKYTIIYTIKVK